MSEGMKGMSRSWKKSHAMSIQMNLLLQYFHIFVFQHFTIRNLGLFLEIFWYFG